MSDLVCERCGAACSYADAYIADREKSCERVERGPGGREQVVGREHEWVAPMNSGIDVVTG